MSHNSQLKQRTCHALCVFYQPNQHDNLLIQPDLELHAKKGTCRLPCSWKDLDQRTNCSRQLQHSFNFPLPLATHSKQQLNCMSVAAQTWQVMASAGDLSNSICDDAAGCDGTHLGELSPDVTPYELFAFLCHFSVPPPEQPLPCTR